MVEEIFIERMSWTNVDQAMAAGYRQVVICAGSIEQHGPHLPEATDSLLGEEYARRLAIRLGKSLVAPVIRPGCSDHHMAFPGSLTISPSLLLQILDGYIESLSHHGFESFVLIASHGGNFPVLAEWERTRARPDSTVISDVKLFNHLFEVIKRFGREDTGGPHADLIETSMMISTNSDLVQMNQVTPGYEDEVRLEDILNSSLREISPTGILGNPVGATAEIGAACLDEWADILVRAVEEQRRSHTIAEATGG